ncbi:MAG TPA: energy transducer TonB [Candidatus Sulfotelmatobacter sp.]|jgi:TonB family protein|nr:energy transducer TonB [Candidatus Sulfotelmatobacter sp.]
MSYAPHHPGAASLKKPLFWSVAFHAALFGSLTVSTIYSHRGEMWGSAGGDGAVSVGLVARVPGVTLPRPDAVTQSQVVDTSKGLYKSEPPPKPQPIEPDVQKIPEFKKEKVPHILSHPSKVFEDKTPPPTNAVPYGQGGSPALPYSSFAMSGPSQGGMGFSGPGGGDFAGRFPSYVDAVRNRISSNWLQSTVDASVRWAPRAEFTFQIMRDGTVANVQMTQSSSNRAVDNSMLRAIQSSNPLSPLPSSYPGSSVTVTFYFDFRR